MIFVIGGREQGKTTYAVNLWKKLHPSGTIRISDGKCKSSEQSLLQADLITHFELIVRREMESGRDPYALADKLINGNPTTIITADEIGCGIVPVDAFERNYRETDGRVCQKIATYSSEVYRIICGLGMRIK